MNFNADTADRSTRQLTTSHTSYGAWLFLPGSALAERAAGLGFDFVGIDLQHGLISHHDALDMIGAIVRTGVVCIVRVPSADAAAIGHMLDAGASGIIIPEVESAEEARSAVEACFYPPLGKRSYGPMRTLDSSPLEYYRCANEAVMCLPMVESRLAVTNVAEILAQEGVSGVYLGPADLSIDLGLAPLLDQDHPEFVQSLALVVAACSAADKLVGTVATGSLARARREQGFDFITVSLDFPTALSAMNRDLIAARGDLAENEVSDADPFKISD